MRGIVFGYSAFLFWSSSLFISSTFSDHTGPGRQRVIRPAASACYPARGEFSAHTFF
jgi:hypothetical protein